MPATAAQIGFVTQQYRVAKKDVAGVLTTYGDFARKDDSPVETFFDDVDDAQIVLDERAALLGIPHRRFKVTAKDVNAAAALDYSQVIPSATLIDTDRSANLTAMITSISIDHERGETVFTVWAAV